MPKYRQKHVSLSAATAATTAATSTSTSTSTSLITSNISRVVCSLISNDVDRRKLPKLLTEVKICLRRYKYVIEEDNTAAVVILHAFQLDELLPRIISIASSVGESVLLNDSWSLLADIAASRFLACRNQLLSFGVMEAAIVVLKTLSDVELLGRVFRLLSNMFVDDVARLRFVCLNAMKAFMVAARSLDIHTNASHVYLCLTALSRLLYTHSLREALANEDGVKWLHDVISTSIESVNGIREIALSTLRRAVMDAPHVLAAINFNVIVNALRVTGDHDALFILNYCAATFPSTAEYIGRSGGIPVIFDFLSKLMNDIEHSDITITRTAAELLASLLRDDAANRAIARECGVLPLLVHLLQHSEPQLVKIGLNTLLAFKHMPESPSRSCRLAIGSIVGNVAADDSVFSLYDTVDCARQAIELTRDCLSTFEFFDRGYFAAAVRVMTSGVVERCLQSHSRPASAFFGSQCYKLILRKIEETRDSFDIHSNAVSVDIQTSEPSSFDLLLSYVSPMDLLLMWLGQLVEPVDFDKLYSNSTSKKFSSAYFRACLRPDVLCAVDEDYDEECTQNIRDPKFIASVSKQRYALYFVWALFFPDVPVYPLLCDVRVVFVNLLRAACSTSRSCSDHLAIRNTCCENAMTTLSVHTCEGGDWLVVNNRVPVYLVLFIERTLSLGAKKPNVNCVDSICERRIFHRLSSCYAVQCIAKIYETKCNEEGGNEDFFAERGPVLVGDNKGDVVFLIAGERITASRHVVASNSDVFETMLFGDFVENKQNEIPIEGVSATTFRNIISLMEGLVPVIEFVSGLCLRDLLDLLGCAHRFMVLFVQSACERRAGDLLTPCSVVEVWYFAMQRRLSKLIGFCAGFLLTSLPAVIALEEGAVSVTTSVKIGSLDDIERQKLIDDMVACCFADADMKERSKSNTVSSLSNDKSYPKSGDSTVAAIKLEQKMD